MTCLIDALLATREKFELSDQRTSRNQREVWLDWSTRFLQTERFDLPDRRSSLNQREIWRAWLTRFLPPERSLTCLIDDLLATRGKFNLPDWRISCNQREFFQPSGYCTVINSVFTFRIRNVFSCFFVVINRFELQKHKSSNSTKLNIHLRRFSNDTWKEAIYNVSTYHLSRFKKHNWYPLLFEMLPSRDIRAANNHLQRYCKIFD